MRDNWNMEELTDQAWGEMKVLLDQEMPVQRSKRRPAVFWWRWAAAVALLLIGLFGGWWFLGESARKVESERMAPPVATIDADKGAATGPTSQAAEIPDPTEEGLPASEPASPPPAKDARWDNRNREASVISAIGLSSETQPGAPTAGSDETGNGTPPAAEITDTGDASPEVMSSLPAAPEKEPSNQAFPFLAPPAQLPAGLIPTLTVAPFPLAGINNRYRSKKSLLVPPEVSGGLIAGLEDGFSPGWLVQVRSGLYLHEAAHWSFQLGLGIHQQRDPFRIRYRRTGNTEESTAEAADPGAVDQNSDPLTETPQPLTVAEAVDSRNIRLQTTYLDVPLLLDWRFAPRWSVAGGTRLSWLLASSWDNGGSSANMDLSLGTPSRFAFDLNSAERGLSIYQAGNSSALTTFEPAAFFASGTLGVSFRPSGKWLLRLEYQHSLTNQLDDSVYAKRDRSLWLSAGLRF